MKIRTKLSFFSIVLAVIMLIVSLLIIFIVNNRAIKAQIRNHLLTTVQSRANHIKTLLDNYKKVTLTLAAGNPIKDGVDDKVNFSLRDKQINRRIKSIIVNYPEIDRIRILNTNGVVIASSSKDIGTDKSNKEIFINGKTNIYIGEIHRSEFSSNIVISISAPIFVRNKFSGVIVINFSVNASLYKLLTNRTGLGKTGKTFLVNKELFLVSPYTSNYDIKEILKTKMDNEQIDFVFFEHIEKGFFEDRIEKVIEYTDHRGKKEIGLHYYIPQLQSLLIAEMDVKEAYKPIYTQTYLLIIILFVLLVFTIVIGLLFARNITSPIVKLHKGTEEINNGNLNFKVGTKSMDEIGQLSRAFDLMTEKLTESQKTLQNRAGLLEDKVRDRTFEMENQLKKSEKQRIATLSILSDLNKTSKDLHQEIIEHKEAEKALVRSEKQVRSKLDAILLPEGNIGILELSDIINIDKIQVLMDEFCNATSVPVGILDTKGNVLVSSGWQDICTKFHRCHPEAAKNCLESDTELSSGIKSGEFKEYKCKNGLWDIVTPIYIGEKHVGNVFTGQFFYDDKKPDYDFFRAQAEKYGFDEEEYISTLDRVPIWNRGSAKHIMNFLARFSNLIAVMAYSNLKLARTLNDNKQAEIQIKSERDIAEMYLYLAGVIFVTVDVNENVTLINRKGCETLGYDHDEIMGTNWFDNFIPELYRHKVKYIFRELMAGRVEGAEYFENSVLTKNGDEKFIAWHNTLLKDKNGNITGTLASGEDITKRKQAENENRNLIQMVEQSPTVVVLTDLNGNIEYVNPKFSEVSGYSFEEAIGQNPRVLKSGETSIEEYESLWEIITNGDIWHGEFHNKKKNGELYWEDATIGPIKNEDGDITHYLAVKEDITNRKQMSGKLQQAQKLEAVGRFAGGIAHDFNNILQVIIGYVFFAEQDLEKDDPRYKNIEEIRRAADKAAALSYQLMAFSSSQILEPRNININKLIDGFLNMIRRIIGENIELKFVCEHNLDSVYADPSQIEQIIMNLCVNARDAMPNGGDLIIKTENILIDDEYCDKYPRGKNGKYILISVSDTGMGMDQLTVDKIFEPFFTTKKENKGTGLGLATVFGIVEQHNGMINVNSEEGKGTIFKVYLPIGENENTDELINQRKCKTKGGTETILIAEDDNSIRNLAVRILEGVGYTVIAAPNGVEAVTLFEKNREEISLVILDIIMPKMGGLKAFKCMEKIQPETKALFCSGYSSKTFWEDSSIEKIKKMHKPYSRNALLNEVRNILDENN